MKLKVKKYVDDETLSWKERYKNLEEHHLAETKELIEMVKYLEERVRIDDILIRNYQYMNGNDGE